MTLIARSSNTHLALLALLALAFSDDSGATTLYKHVDKEGRVTYSDRPSSGTSKGVTIPIDQNTLAPPPPKAVEPYRPVEAEYEKIIRRKPPDAPAKDDAIKSARKRLEDAKAALQSAQDSSSPEDWIYRPKNNRGGTLRFPRPEYAERLTALEADVKAAETNLEEVERKQS